MLNGDLAAFVDGCTISAIAQCLNVRIAAQITETAMYSLQSILNLSAIAPRAVFGAIAGAGCGTILGILVVGVFTGSNMAGPLGVISGGPLGAGAAC